MTKLVAYEKLSLQFVEFEEFTESVQTWLPRYVAVSGNTS